MTNQFYLLIKLSQIGSWQMITARRQVKSKALIDWAKGLFVCNINAGLKDVPFEYKLIENNE